MKFANRLKETTTVMSMDSVTLAGAVTGFRSLAKIIATSAAQNDPNAIKVGDANIPFTIEDGAGNWEEGLFTITSATVLTRTSILDSSNDGAAVTAWQAGAKNVFCSAPAQWLAKLAALDEGVTIGQLNTSTLADALVVEVFDPSSSSSYKATLSALKAYTGSSGSDTTAPTTPSSLTSSNVSQAAATLNWAASSDNVGVTAYEVSRDGTTWTNVGNVLTYTFTGLNASTLYTLQVRAMDAAANRSPAASLAVTTAAPGGDSTPPNMAGSITPSNVTANGLTMTYAAGTDNVGVARYEVSVDTGTASWVANGTNLSYNATGLAASTAYTLRVRCFDAAGNVSNVLTASVTTSAAAPQVYTITPYTSGNSIPTSLARSNFNDATGTWGGTPPINRFMPAKQTVMGGTYWNFSPATASNANVRCGWSLDNTKAPAEITTGQNSTGSSSINGLVPMGTATSPSWVNQGYLWAREDAPSGPWYFWIRVGTEDHLMNPAGMMVT